MKILTVCWVFWSHSLLNRNLLEFAFSLGDLVLIKHFQVLESGICYKLSDFNEMLSVFYIFKTLPVP